jgi:hypothetical protein
MDRDSQKVYDIFYSHDINAVIMDWNGYSTSKQFREGTEMMLKVLVENKTSKVLAEIQDMVIIGGEDQVWLETQFLPRAIKSGFKAVAMVKPKSYFNKIAVETVSYKIDKEKLAISFFDTVEEAKNWLQSLPY